ncbi:D-2-hydroxyacid dehydrogenase [Marinomonas sp. 2405UD68-3]|uniref:D-2-hydroxyacid dehydrogenase n=1 Tax=Marinomonas sp. 2405UD68-3 TaxID=3391835 RepID=UPI0039C8F606
MKAVFLDRGSFPDYIQFNAPNNSLKIVEYADTKTTNIVERITDADIILVNKTVLTAEHLSQCKRLKMIQITATGMNNVDLDYCSANNIVVNNVANYSANSVPEHAFSLLLNLKRNLGSYISDVKKGKWSESTHFCFLDHPIKDLANSTMLIVGSGNIGQNIARIAQAFGIKCLFSERRNAQTIREGRVSFEEGIKVADIITLHCPLTAENRSLIGQQELRDMKSSALLLNVSRGGLVDEHALIEAIKNNEISGAAMDVATVEPMPENHPLNQLSDYPNFILTPHVAWASDEAMQTLSNLAMDQIKLFMLTHNA